MTTPVHGTTSGTELWRRLVRRFAFGRTLQRPRVPIVLMRRRTRARYDTTARRQPASQVWHQHIAVHVHLAWPAWLRAGERPAGTPDRLPIVHGVARRFAAAIPQLTAAPSASSVRPPASEPPDGRLIPLAGRVLTAPAQGLTPTASRALTAGVGLPVADGPAGDLPAGPAARRAPRRAASRRMLSRSLVAHRQTTAGGAGVLARVHPAAARVGSLARRSRADDGVRTRRRGTDAVAVTGARALPPSPPTARTPAARVSATVHTASPARFPAPVQRTLAIAPTERPHDIPNTRREATAAPATATTRPPAVPALDIVRLSDDVYRHIQRRMRIERERRGL